MFLRLIFFVSILIAVAVSAEANEQRPGERPVIFTTDSMLAEAREAVRAEEGIVFAAWQKVVERAEAALKTEFNPYQKSDYLRYFRTGRDQGRTIRNLAIAYRISGDIRFRDRARELLLQWARAFHADFDYPHQYPASEIPHASGLVIGRTSVLFADAYALLWPELSVGEDAEIASWFRSLVAPIKESLRLWEVGTYNGMEPPYFNRQYFNNHLGACNLGLAAIGFALRDPEIIDYVMKPAPALPDRAPGETNRSNPRDFHVLLAGAILMPGDFGSGEEGDVYRGKSGDPSLTGAPPPLPGEIWDRYRARQGKGIHYVLLHLRVLTLIAEIAHNNQDTPHFDGPDFFQFLGRRGENLKISYEVYADWYTTMDPSSVNNGYYVDSAIANRPSNIEVNGLALYELVARRYPKSEKIAAALQTRENAGDRLVFDPETFGWTAPLLYGGQ